jgi:FixJ family two-component response regulator
VSEFTVGRPRVFLVDDDPSVLSALGRLLLSAGYEVASFSSAREFLLDSHAALPGCAVLDIRMTEIDGLSLQQEMSSRGDVRPIIFLTGCDDAATSVRAMKAGAMDYLVKPVQDTDLLAAIETAVRLDDLARRRQHDRAGVAERYSQLTPREREVMARVVEGNLNKQIAYKLGIGEKTVKVHRARIMEKMAVRSVAVLVHIWEQWNLSEIDDLKV